MGIPANYKVLFLQGGRPQQFAQIPMNLLRGRSADYVHHRLEWSKKAIKAAKRIGNVNVVAGADRDKSFTRAPPRPTEKLDPRRLRALHCTNETIHGVEFQLPERPRTGDVPLVCRHVLHILSKPVDVSKFGLIYAGAQKNIGPAGLTIVIVRDDLLGKAQPTPPAMLDYKPMADAELDATTRRRPTASTSPAWCSSTSSARAALRRWRQRNIEKANLLYDYHRRPPASTVNPVAKWPTARA
jgi:phosphoserine aminotransferase